MLEFSHLNWIAVAGATVLAFVLGGLWYGPLFGQAWLRALGKTQEDIKPSATPFVVSFFTAGLTAIVLAALIKALAIAGPMDGAMIGAITGIGFIATAMASDSAFCGWSLRLFLIQSGYRVTYSILMGIVLALWQ